MRVGKASYDPIAGTEGSEVHATSASALFWPAVVAACAAASFACGWALAAAAQGRQPGVELAQAHLTHLGQRAQALGAPALSAVPHTPRLPPAQEDELWAVYDSILKTRRFVDLTHAFDPQIPHWKGFTAETVAELYSYGSDGFWAQRFCHVGQWGTLVLPDAVLPGGDDSFGALKVDEQYMKLLQDGLKYGIRSKHQCRHKCVCDADCSLRLSDGMLSGAMELKMVGWTASALRANWNRDEMAPLEEARREKRDVIKALKDMGVDGIKFCVERPLIIPMFTAEKNEDGWLRGFLFVDNFVSVDYVATNMKGGLGNLQRHLMKNLNPVAHVDPPAHFVPGKRTVDLIRPEEMVMPLVVVDVHEKVLLDPDYTLSMADIRGWEKKHAQLIPAGAFVAMRTDWAHRWPDGAAMDNKDADGVPHYPGWSLEVLRYLYEERNISASGHETTDTDPGLAVAKDDYALETYILGRDRFQVELLANLDQVPERGALVVAAFPKPKAASGFPARVFAILP